MGLIVFIGGLLLLMLSMNPSATLSQSPIDVQCASSQTCGTLNVSYPFKLTSQPTCPSFSRFFDLECKGEDLFLHNFTFNFIRDWPLKVLHIQSDSLIVDATDLKAMMELNSTDGTCSVGGTTFLELPGFPGPFVFADDNRFASFGCTTGTLMGTELVPNRSSSEPSFPSNFKQRSCSVDCPDNEMNQECNGGTCCVSDFENGTSFRLVMYLVSSNFFAILNNKSSNLVDCKNSYATIFYPSYANFSNYGLKITWALASNQTSFEIQKSKDFACSNHSNITIVKEVRGYRCSCQQGFTGDGYLHGSGCTDVDECTNASLNECIQGKSTCQSIEGNYTCKCNNRYYVGDGMEKGSGCKLSPTLKNAILIIGGMHKQSLK